MKLAFDDVKLCTLRLFTKTKGETLVFKLGALSEFPKGVEVDKEHTYLVFDGHRGRIYSGDYEKGPFYQIGEALLSDREMKSICAMLA